VKKFFIQILLLIILIFAALLSSPLRPTSFSNPFFKPKPVEPAPQTRSSQLKIANILLNIEVADTQSKRSKGLGGRSSLASDSGMLFIFPKEDQYKFWMKGLSFPLDIIWIKGDQIVDITKNVPPPSVGQKDEDLLIYSPKVAVDSALEVNGGFCDIHGIKEDDRVELIEQ
jgi:uncharacterized protein